MVWPGSRRSQQEEVLEARVRASFIASEGPMVPDACGMTCLALGLLCGLHRVKRLMRGQALRARPRWRRLPVDLDEGPAGGLAANMLDHGFAALAPNGEWIADLTYVWTAAGWLYAAAIDLLARHAIGCFMLPQMIAQLVTDPLLMATCGHGKSDELLRHSDRGSQHNSE